MYASPLKPMACLPAHSQNASYTGSCRRFKGKKFSARTKWKPLRWSGPTAPKRSHRVDKILWW